MSEKVVFKPAGVAETFGIGWQRYIVDAWARESRYASGDIVAPPVGNGYFYVASVVGAGAFGFSSRLTPEFVPTDAETTVDGSIIWTARLPAALSLLSINTSVWALDTGIVEDSSTIVDFDALITVSGGVEGEQYRMTNTITKSNGEDEEESMILEIIKPEDV